MYIALTLVLCTCGTVVLTLEILGTFITRSSHLFGTHLTVNVQVLF
jgi:hypothetical protein